MKIEQKKFISQDNEGMWLDYYIGTPEKDGKHPLVVLAHGAGSRFGDISKLKEHSVWKPFTEGVGENAIFVIPHCKTETWFDSYQTLNEFIDSMRQMENVDQKRVYITGYSMGGYTTWQLIRSHKDWYAAAIPICGGSNYSASAAGKAFSDLPIWAFHGLLDNIVFVEESIKLIRGINMAGGSAKLSVYDDVRHNAWIPAYSSKETWEWLFSQIKK